MSNFRLQTKGVFLTYPQCPADRETVRDMLQAKGYNVVKGIVGQEQHQDGNFHLHAYAKFDRQIDVKNARHFDLEFNSKIYHGKYETAKSAIKSIRYITKHDTTPLELGDMDWK